MGPRWPIQGYDQWYMRWELGMACGEPRCIISTWHHGLTKIRCQSLHQRKEKNNLSVIRFAEDLASRPVTASNLHLNLNVQVQVTMCPWVFSLFSSSAPALKNCSAHFTTFIEDESIPFWLDVGSGIYWIIRMDSSMNSSRTASCGLRISTF